MNSNENLIKATVNRLAVRATESLEKTINKISILAKESPEKLKKEWEIFQEEVQEEADRLSQVSNDPDVDRPSDSDSFEEKSMQNKIDSIREKISRLSQKIEMKY